MQSEKLEDNESSINIKNDETKTKKKYTKHLVTVNPNHVGTPAPSFKIERAPPNGFFVIKADRGRVPSKLEGFFTEYQRAVTAILSYNKEAKYIDATQGSDTSR